MRRFVIKHKNTSVMPRKGIIGDWKNHFTDQDLEFYRSVVGENTERLADLAVAHETLGKLFASAAERESSGRLSHPIAERESSDPQSALTADRD